MFRNSTNPLTMPAWLPRSTFGAVLAVVYIVGATLLVMGDRGKGGGSWISLNGIISFLATFPVSLLGEKLGMRPDFRRNADMAFAIGVCAVLVYLLGAGLARLARAVFASGTQG